VGNGLRKWIKKLKKGDQSAFLPFYQETAPGLLRFLLWKTSGDRPLSEDILQESYVKFLVSLDRLDSTEDLAVKSYMFKIVKNCLIDKAGRSAYARAEHVSVDNIAELVDLKQTARQEKAVELRELKIAMEALNEKESEIIWLRDGLGLSHREVASQVGITEQASRQAYVRAKKNLVAELAGSWFPQEPAIAGGAYATT